jgi:hypothetical protein
MLGAMLVRVALGFVAFLGFAMTPCSNARAHGVPPTAYAVVAHDAQGAKAVRLSTGVALRRASERFQFVCPAAWGDEYAAPLAALDDGTLVVGAVNGLMLLSEDGQVRPHPDPAALGISTELVRGARGVFSLRITPEGSELLAIDAEHVRVIFRDAKSWYSLAAIDDKLLLLRVNGNAVEQLVVSSLDGAELDRQLATLATPVDYAFARAAGGTAYALLLYQASSELGSLGGNAFKLMAKGVSSVAGPLTIGTSTLLAVDGQLSHWVAGEPVPLAETAYVACLEQAADLTYACKPEGIARVNAQGLAEPLFKLDWLVAPSLDALPTSRAKDRCDYQWQDMRFDLIALGMPLPEEAAQPIDAGVVGAEPEPEPAGAEPSEIDVNPGDEDTDASELDAGAATKRKSAGCSATPAATTRVEWLAPLALAGLWLCRSARARSRAPGSRPRPSSAR